MAMVMLLGVAAIALVATAAAVWLGAMAVHDGSGGRAPALPPRAEEHRRTDPALDELRHRYARGEIGREEFLQRKIDLEE